MIIKVDYDMMCTLLSVGTLPGAFGGREADLDHLMQYVPEWMQQFAYDGSAIMLVSRDEFDDLDYEIAEHVEVLKY